jgi:malonate decarboxylase beta subunit
MNESILIPDFVNRKSFIELDARARAQSLFDKGTWRELVGPFDRIESPWLTKQGIAPQFDDGCVVIKGKIGGSPAVAIAFEGAFQGGSVGEVSGAKMTAALDLATQDSERLQEANLGLAAVAEIISSALALRKHAPVITIVAGTVGCFGGMSLVAGVSSYTIMTREARLGLNGPEVIEQESGIDEFDSSDRALIWAIHGGEQRVGMGLADLLVEDDADKIAAAVRDCVHKDVPERHRTEQVELYRARIAALDTSSQIDPATLRQHWANPKGGVR